MKRWNSTVVKSDPRRKVEFTPELLEELGESGLSQTGIAKKLGVSKQLVSRHINQSETNRRAFEKGRLKKNGSVTSKNR